jgi:DNA-binding IclR family transcriptional regulator
VAQADATAPVGRSRRTGTEVPISTTTMSKVTIPHLRDTADLSYTYGFT